MHNTVSQFVSELRHYRTVVTDFEKRFYFGEASKYETSTILFGKLYVNC